MIKGYLQKPLFCFFFYNGYVHVPNIHNYRKWLLGIEQTLAMKHFNQKSLITHNHSIALMCIHLGCVLAFLPVWLLPLFQLAGCHSRARCWAVSARQAFQLEHHTVRQQKVSKVIFPAQKWQLQILLLIPLWWRQQPFHFPFLIPVFLAWAGYSLFYCCPLYKGGYWAASQVGGSVPGRS